MPRLSGRRPKMLPPTKQLRDGQSPMVPVQQDPSMDLQGMGGGGNSLLAAALAQGTGADDDDSGGYKGDSAAFMNRMGMSFGTDLDARLHEGDAGEAGTAAGAIATTQGNDVFLGVDFDAMNQEDQEFILAHELAHVDQSTNGNFDQGVGNASAIEADADSAAATALAGGDASTAVAADPGTAYNFSLPSWDDIKEGASDVVEDVGDFVEGVGDDAMEAILDGIESAAELLNYLATLSQDLVEKAIDFIVAHKVELALGLLVLNPAAGILVYVVTVLPDSKFGQWLATIDPITAAKVIGVVVGAGAVAVVVAPLFALGGNVLMPILRAVGAPVLVLLWSHAPQEMKDWVKSKLVQYWPVGLGLALAGSLGATFGYPVYLGAEAYASVSHAAEGQFKLIRGGIMTEAFDTGVGAGAFVGVGKSKDGEGGIGLGAEAGAQFQAGLKQVVHQEFQFDVMEDNAFLSFLITASGQDMGGPMSVLSSLSDEFRAIDPMSYNTKTKFEFKAFAEGNAHASAGVRTGGKDTVDGGTTWNSQEGKADTGNPRGKWWMRWLQASVFGRIAGEAGVGFEMENKEFTEDSAGVRVPSKMEVSAYGEASAALSIAHSIPMISSALPAGINFDGGGGIKVKWLLTGSPEDTTPEVSDPTYSLYVKTGDMDRYNGAASETSIGVGNLNAETFESLDTFLSKISASAEFTRRFSIGTQIGRKYFNAADKQGAFNVMLPSEYRNYGFRLEGYLDLKAQISAEMIRSIFKSIASVVQVYQEGGEPLQQLYMDVMTFFATGKAPAHVAREATNIADTILKGLTDLKLHGLVGLSVAAGGQLSAGAKVRLQGRVGAQITMDVDLLQYAKGELTVEDIKKLMDGAIDKASGVLDVDGTQS